MKKARALPVILLLVLLCLSARPAWAETPRNLTLMVYMCGSNLESMFGSATEDLMEIKEACGGNDAVTVLLMMGGANSWTGDWIDAEETAIYEIRSRGLRKMQSFPAMNMGQADTLSAFLDYSCENRPAQQYALIFWDHGAGPMEGVCFDQNNDMDSLSLQEIEEALRESPFSGEAHLSWIGFDACMMATLETAIRCAPYADYMVASQETEPSSGWNYAFLRQIREGESAQETCERILDAYPEGKKEGDLLTISLIRLDSARELGLRADLFFDAVRMQLNAETFPIFSIRRLKTKSFGRLTTASDYDLVDLADLIARCADCAPKESEKLMRALEATVVRTAGNQERANGLSIYFPYYNKNAFLESWMKTFRQLGTLVHYSRFIDRFGALLTGAPLKIWGHLRGTAEAPGPEGTQIVSLELTDEQLTHYAEGFVTILEDDGSGVLFYAINYIPVPQPQGNTLQAEVSFEALYAVDENGVIETSAIPYAVAGDNYLVFGHLETRSWLDYSVENEVQKVLLLCAKKEGSNELEIRSFHAINDDDDLSELNLGRQDFEPDPAIWRYIQFAGFPQAVQRDEEGSMLPYDQWPVEEHMLTISLEGIDPDGNRIPFIEWASAEEYPQGMHHDTEVDNSRPWTLRFCPQRTGGKDLVAQFDVMDTQGDHWGSELIPLQKPDVCAVVSVDCAPRDFYGVTVQPYEIKVIRNDAFQGLCLRVQVENHTEDSVMLNILYPLVNGISRNKPDGDNLSVFTGNRYILPGTSGIADYYFDASCLPWREDPIVRTISFVPNHDADMQPFDRLLKDLDRITVETELDVSMLPLPEKPKEPLASDTTPDGLVMELLDLQAGEEGSPSLLSGTVRMLNPTEKIVWIFFAAGKDDSLETAYLNKNFLQNCLRIADYDFLLPGGEGVYDFDVVPDSDGVLWISPNLRLPGADSPPPEQVLDRVEEIGFAHETVAADRQEGEATPFYVHELFLPEPLPLSAPCRILVE